MDDFALLISFELFNGVEFVVRFNTGFLLARDIAQSIRELTFWVWLCTLYERESAAPTAPVADGDGKWLVVRSKAKQT